MNQVKKEEETAKP